MTTNALRTQARRAAPPRLTAKRPETAPESGRKAPRKSTLLPGYITHERAGLPLACRVIDMSSSGARLIVVTTERSPASVVEDMPDQISLFLSYDRFSVACIVKWRDEDKIGVNFVSVPRIIEKPPTKVAKPAAKKK